MESKDKNDMYTIEFTPAAERAIKKLSADIQKRIIKAILKLEENPRPPGIKKLSGEDNLYRIRVGDYRIIFASSTKSVGEFRFREAAEFVV